MAPKVQTSGSSSALDIEINIDPEALFQQAQKHAQSRPPPHSVAPPSASCGCSDAGSSTSGVAGAGRARRAGLQGAEGDATPGSAGISEERMKQLDPETQDLVKEALEGAQTPEARAQIAQIVNSEGFSQLNADHRAAALDAVSKAKDKKIGQDIADLISDSNFRNLNDAVKSDVLGQMPKLEANMRGDMAKLSTHDSFQGHDAALQKQALGALTAKPHDERFVGDLTYLMGTEQFRKQGAETKGHLVDTFGKNSENVNGRAAAALESGATDFKGKSAEDQAASIDKAVKDTQPTKPGEQITFPPAKGYREGVSTPQSVLGQASGSDKLGENSYAGLGENKKAVVDALKKKGASEDEIALILAVGMQETTNMDANRRDHGKTGDATNYSAFNMNKDMLNKLGVSNPEALNDPKNIGEAAGKMLDAFRTWGVESTLAYHRGGETAFKDGSSYGAKDFTQGIADIAAQIKRGKHYTDDVRVERNTAHV